MLGNVFYWQTLRKLTACFGSLFYGITIVRYSENGNQGTPLKSFRVPLSYAPTEKDLALLKEKIPAGTKPRVGITYPRMSFTMTGMQYDASRKLTTTGFITQGNTSYVAADKNDFLKQLNPIPVDVAFDLDIACKYVDDMYQIIEQIIPFFTQSFTMNIKDIPEFAHRDIPVILQSVQPFHEFEGDFKDPSIVQCKLTFVCKAYIYPPIRDTAIIKKVIAYLYKDEEIIEDNATGVITVRLDPLDAGIDDPHEIITEIEE